MSLTFTAHDLRTGKQLSRLPFTGWFDETLNDAGMIQGTVDLATRSRSGKPLAQALIDATTPRRTVIWVQRDQRLLDGYIIWARPGTFADGRLLVITGASIFSYFLRRRMRETRNYHQVDQTAIAGDLIAYAQSHPGSDINVAIDTPASGVPRNRQPIAWDFELRVIGTLIQQLAGVIGGFDFSIDASIVNDQPQATFRTHYPRRGRTAAANGLVFSAERRGNLLDVRLAEDESERPNTVLGVGAGEDITQLGTPAVNMAEIDAGYPLVEGSYVRKNIYETDTLDANTAAELHRRADSDRWRLVIDPSHKMAPLGSWVVGDDARVIIPPGKYWRWPNGFDGVLRIVGQRIETTANRSTEIVELTMGRARG